MNWVQSELGVEQDESVTLTLETDEDVIWDGRLKIEDEVNL